MTVADLIILLQQHDQSATVVLWDHDERPVPLLSKLKPSDIQSLQLTGWESNGVLMLEVFEDRHEGRPIPGVVLGSM
jgi:hypothetical protein